MHFSSCILYLSNRHTFRHFLYCFHWLKRLTEERQARKKQNELSRRQMAEKDAFFLLYLVFVESPHLPSFSLLTLQRFTYTVFLPLTPSFSLVTLQWFTYPVFLPFTPSFSLVTLQWFTYPVFLPFTPSFSLLTLQWFTYRVFLPLTPSFSLLTLQWFTYRVFLFLLHRHVL